MAQTDAKPGFRLPWSSDRQSTETSDSDSTTDSPSEAVNGWPSEDASSSAPASSAAPASPADTADVAHDTNAPDPAAAVEPWPGPAVTTDSQIEAAVAPAVDSAVEAPRSGKKPTKFMADLTKAMQAAAEDARGRALSQLQADAKTQVETIHGRSSTGAATLRRGADDDVAAVREWSKAEIARIREETETRITDRKSRLETEIEQHSSIVEREIEAVQKTVAAFEDEMAAFFERLLGEEDPSRFATMAENLPEPPTFDDMVAGPETADANDDAATATVETEADAVVGTVDVEVSETAEADAAVAVAEADVAVGEVDAETAVGDADAEAEPTTAETEATDDEPGTAQADSKEGSASATGSIEGVGRGEGGDAEVDRESAFAAIQAAAEAAASAEVAADAAARAEAVADVAIEIMGNHDDEGEADPRFAALGLSPDYDAAEAEALAAAGTSDEAIPEIGDDALAARLASLVPGKNKGNSGDTSATQVVVVGLVSVASIASFKRHLGRVPGVQSVGVSSGPDGEFIFAVNHGGDSVLRDAIPSLPSFQARVTGSSDGVVHVTAHDPEADA